RRLSELIGKRVTKKNCRAILENYITTHTKPNLPPQQKAQPEVLSFPHKLDSPSMATEKAASPDRFSSTPSPPYPNGPLPLDSHYYIQRPRVEAQIYEQITKPGALVRIKAPQEMGKTSLLLRVLQYAKERNYRTVNLNLQQIDRGTLNDFDRFLRWICANVSRQLDLESKLADYWDEEIGSGISGTLYMQDYILESINAPVVLAFDEVNRVFEHPQVALDFLPLLRSWFEEAKKTRIWENLRIMVVHSTEIYVPLHLTQSPFNVGLPLALKAFNLTQVQELARRYGLNWSDGIQAQQLMALVGGHPGLLQVAFYHLHQDKLTLTQLLKTAATTTGIYAHHLRRHSANLQEEPELNKEFAKVVSAIAPVELEPIASYKLYSMGLIKLDGNKATVSCELYRQYFSHKTEESKPHDVEAISRPEVLPKREEEMTG
ncbi:MAG: AAA-like domain-containing protein, partial [Spirulina sp.]